MNLLSSPSKIGPLIIFGAGGHAKVVIETARSTNCHPDLVIDDNPHDSSLLNVPVARTDSIDWKSISPFRFVVAIGDNAVREHFFELLKNYGGLPQTVIHPFTSISPTASIGAGTVIFAGVSINAAAHIGDNCILNTGCRIDHDARIGSSVHLCPGAVLAGTVRIGDRTMIGTGACCIPGISIGSDCVIGAGSVVVRPVASHGVAYGNPARTRREVPTKSLDRVI